MIGRLLNGLAATLGAAGFAQFPAFLQQYLQRLGGRLDQARLDVARLLEDARSQGQTLEAYLAELGASGSGAAAGTAERELARVEAVHDLEAAYQALAQAEPMARPTAFLAHFDAGIAQETLKVFAPAVPVTGEALVYAGAGILVALLALAGGESGYRGAVKRIKGQQVR
jgi:hypothetical protein